ncbi:alpha/beta hydrolase [uncultured Enterovirga sp.]|uniref:alpha/beta hydrolase n=1 Tax=uncultured Enterovirga sp. TaxID=2026352 RepID=UPI0035CB7CB7
MRILLGVAIVAALAYLFVVALLFAGQRRFLFPANAERTSAAAAGLADMEDVAITTEDGERLVAWWKPPRPGRALVVYFHGNGGSLWNRRDRARLLTEGGRGLLMVSYRGYSGSTGSPSEAGLRQDAMAAYRFVSGYEPRRLVLHGESLGTALAIWLASQKPVGGIILDAPFTSIADVAQPLFRFVPVGLLLRDTFRSIDRIAEIRSPLLVMHGEEDGVIPIALADRLFAAAREPKRFLRLPGIDHVGVLESGGMAAVGRFLGEVESGLEAGENRPISRGG